MTRRLSLAAAVAMTLALASAQRAVARNRLGVLMTSEADQRLGDNLTDVAIAEAAEVVGDALVGSPELRTTIAQIGEPTDLVTCAEHLGCIVAVARAGGLARVLVGTVHSSSSGYRVRVALVDATTGTETGALVQEVATEAPALIAAVQFGVRRLLAPTAPPSSATSLPAAPVAPVAAPLASPLEADASPAAASDRDGAGRSRTRSVVAYGAAGLALASFATAVVTGAIGSGDPAGSTRIEAEQDLARRKDYARVANGCWIAGGVLSIVSATAFVWRW